MQIENKMVIDLAEMPSGERYEDRYGAYLEIFHTIAMSESKVEVIHPPASWVPLLWYLGCMFRGPQNYFEHCGIVQAAWENTPKSEWNRTTIEVMCGFRPETTDALWKIDMQWMMPPGRLKQLRVDDPFKKEFIVTTNGSFHRPEVRHYLNMVLPVYTPKKKKVVLVPCAADKPYPVKLHQEVLKRMPEDYYLAIHTGVLGIVPQDLWDEMPYYDSGLPNEWRLARILYQYFSAHRHESIVVYADFYSLAIDSAFRDLGHYFGIPKFVNEVKAYDDYLDLLAPERLKALEETFEEEEEEHKRRIVGDSGKVKTTGIAKGWEPDRTLDKVT